MACTSRTRRRSWPELVRAGIREATASTSKSLAAGLTLALRSGASTSKAPWTRRNRTSSSVCVNWSQLVVQDGAYPRDAGSGSGTRRGAVDGSAAAANRLRREVPPPRLEPVANAVHRTARHLMPGGTFMSRKAAERRWLAIIDRVAREEDAFGVIASKVNQRGELLKAWPKLNRRSPNTTPCSGTGRWNAPHLARPGSRPKGPRR